MTIDELHEVLKREVKGLRKEMRKEMRTEGATTRRLFDVVAERIESHVKLVAEVNSHHATVLDNHETRLQKIEKRP